jgi:hypothetical protein
MLNNYEDKVERIIKAGERAVEELIKVLHSEIITDDPDKDITADKMKNAASAKKMALNDAFDILNRIELERDKLNGAETKQDDKIKTFAESRGRKSL